MTISPLLRNSIFLAGLMAGVYFFWLIGLIAPPDYTGNFTALDTFFEISIYGCKPGEARKLLSLMRECALGLEKKYSVHVEDSEISRINSGAGGRSVSTDGETGRLLVRSLEIEKASGGLFTPAILSLTRLWDLSAKGDCREHPESERAFLVPGDDEIHEARYASGQGRLNIVHLAAGETAVELAPGAGLDLGGIAKGHVIDRCAQLMKAAGFAGIVNAGGDMALVGQKKTGKWRIGVKKPGGHGLLAILELDGGSIATSGDYERFFDMGGRRFHHIMDPRTGWPAEGLVSVTTAATDAVTADAAATAAFVAGPSRAVEVALASGALWVLAVDSSGNPQTGGTGVALKWKDSKKNDP